MKLAKAKDTGWENILGTSVKGRILNGFATLVFEGPLLKEMTVRESHP